MMFSRYKKPRKLRILLVAIILVALGTIVAVYVGYRRISSAPEMLISTLKEGADMSIGKIHQTATRDGRKEWSLEASSAHYMEDKNQVILQDLSVTFFLKDNSEVYLTAKQGILNTDSNDIEVSGNVVVKKEDYRLTTENLNYQHSQRIITSKTQVVISGKSAELKADSLRFDLNTNQVVMEGQVAGVFSEDMEL